MLLWNCKDKLFTNMNSEAFITFFTMNLISLIKILKLFCNYLVLWNNVAQCYWITVLHVNRVIFLWQQLLSSGFKCCFYKNSFVNTRRNREIITVHFTGYVPEKPPTISLRCFKIHNFKRKVRNLFFKTKRIMNIWCNKFVRRKIFQKIEVCVLKKISIGCTSKLLKSMSMNPHSCHKEKKIGSRRIKIRKLLKRNGTHATNLTGITTRRWLNKNIISTFWNFIL